jgi:hypothetical protein
METLSYQDAHAYAYGYLSAELTATVAKLRNPNTNAAELADKLEKVLIQLEADLQSRKGK